MRTVTVLSVPYAWLQAIGNNTAALLLADILGAFSGQHSDRTLIWDGNELLLEYKKLQSRLGVSERSISRAIDLLAKRKAVIYHRRDRVVNGKRTRNVVGVILNMDAIAKLSRISLGDISSTPRIGSPSEPSVGGSVGSPSRHSVSATHFQLTDFQVSLVRAYQQGFEEIVGSPYRTSSEQNLADLRAVASFTIPKARGAGHEYAVWSLQYLQALKDKAEQVHTNVRDLAFDRHGQVRADYTIEWFVDWAKTDRPLPNGFARRSFQRGRTSRAKSD